LRVQNAFNFAARDFCVSVPPTPIITSPPTSDPSDPHTLLRSLLELRRFRVFEPLSAGWFSMKTTLSCQDQLVAGDKLGKASKII